MSTLMLTMTAVALVVILRLVGLSETLTAIAAVGFIIGALFWDRRPKRREVK
jgi:hypothetical protein